MKRKILSGIVFGLFLFTNEAWSGCELKISEDFGIDAPLLLNSRTPNFIYPTLRNPKEVLISTNFKVIAFCPGSTVIISEESTNKENVEISCFEKTKFKILGGVHEFKNIRCSKTPEIAIRTTNDCPNGNLIEIGFKYTDSIFIRTILLCYNVHLASTLWAHNVIPTTIMDNEAKIPFHTFIESELSKNFSMHDAYDGDEQRRMLLKIMSNDHSLLEKYMPRTGSKYFGRTHLVSRADQFYAIQQLSTFQYLNVVPIWQCINNGNWRNIEFITRKLAKQTGDLSIYTGVFDNLQLAYSPTENRKIFLADHPTTGKPAIFVPKFIFKLIYSPVLKKAIVYITINNPYLSKDNFSNDYKICKEYEQCMHTNPSFSNFSRGYSYCCLYDDFIRNRFVRSLGLPKLPFVTPF